MTSRSVPEPIEVSSSPESEAARRRRFSMLREFTLADVITLANGFAGMGAILFTLKYLDTRELGLLWYAFALLPLAGFFDYVDGRVARWRQQHTPLGAQLDSLADLISFGVAPAVLAFAVGMRGGWDALFLVYFVGCGVSRLARYNVTCGDLADESGKVPYFEGTPIPTSMVLVALLAALLWQGRTLGTLPLGAFQIGPWLFHPLVLVYFVSGSAMISKTLRIPKP
ncbi:MAG TPA: CDP-alcohol phosphatidyltransferase family protein [Polyangiaceae bacterium]